MLISRNQPGVATCDDCREPTRPCYSWSLNDDSDGLGVTGLGSLHLCALCLHKYVAKLDALPPFMAVMRMELADAGVSFPTAARYDDVRALYQEAGLERAAAPAGEPGTGGVEAVTDTNAIERPTLTQVRRGNRAYLEGLARQHMPWLTFEELSREQIAEELVAHFERVTAEASA